MNLVKLPGKGEFKKKMLGEGATGLSDPASINPLQVLHWCKVGLHRCKKGFWVVQRLLGDLCLLSPKDLLHPPLTTFGDYRQKR